jgi:hypothetical protein
MFKSVVNSFLHQSMRSHSLKLPLAGLMLIVGVGAGNATPTLTNNAAQSIQPHQAQVTQATPNNQTPDGIYLYSQSSQPEEIGQEYMVFEVRRGRVIGAVYMPHSEFNCFYGTLASRKLDLMVNNPFAETADSSPPEDNSNTEFAAVGDFPRIGNGDDPINFPLTVNLQDYQRIAAISENDQRILGICKANHQEQVWSR